jgi:hypothetical protein
MSLYWDEKYNKLFGEDHTFGPLTLNHLKDNEIEGGFGVLERDYHGRLIILGDRGVYCIKSNGRTWFESTRFLLLTILKQRFGTAPNTVRFPECDWPRHRRAAKRLHLDFSNSFTFQHARL